MNYSIDYKAMGIWIAVAVALSSSIYLFMTYNSQNSQNYQISLDEDTTPGELTRLSVNSANQPVQGANISIDGEFIGTTNSQGIKGFETPENNFTVKASKDDILSETTFTFEDGSFSSPDDSEGSDQDGADEDSSDGSNDDSEDSDNEDSNQDSSDDDQQDSSDTVDDFTGIEIDEDPMIGELRTITVYDEGEAVSGAEVTVNGEIVGTTNAGGTVTFGVPNAAEVSVSTDTGLSKTFTVQDYTEEDQNQTDDQNDTEEDLTTGIELDSDPVSGTNNRIILYDQGDRVSGETVYLDGNELGQTGSNGAIEFEVPLQEQITVSTDYDLESQTFNVTENHPEPEITLLSPDSGEEFETPEGDETDIEFEATIETTENSGTAKLIIGESEAYTQELSQGENTISTTQGLSSGAHDWSIDVDTEEHSSTSNSRDLTVNEVELEDSLSLQNNPVAGEYNYVRLYDSGEPVGGEEISVSGDSIGTTDSNGEIGFEVPNKEDITVEASGYDSITRTVEGYTEEINMSFSFSDTIYQGRANTLTVTNQESGETLNDATVYANGVEQGQTDSSGQITFDIPEENSVTVKAVKDNSDDNKSFTSEDPPLMVSINSPSDGQSFGNYRVSFNLELDSASQGTVNISIDGENKLSDSISSGENTVDEDFVMENSGTHDYTISVSNQEETRTKEGSFTTSEDFPPPEIFVDSPTEGMEFGSSTASLDYRIMPQEDESFSYTIEIDGREIRHVSSATERVDNQMPTFCHSEGSHSLNISSISGSTGEMSSTVRSFETTGSPPSVEKHWTVPERGTIYESPVQFNYAVAGCENGVNYDVDVEQDGEVVSDIDSGTLDKWERRDAPEESFDLSPGDYDFIIKGQNQDSSKVPFSVE